MIEHAPGGPGTTPTWTSSTKDMVGCALGYIARTGPATEQDRWEESAGINPFTLAVCVAALVAGAELLPPPACDWAFELADFWNSNIERWTSVVARRSPSG
jgi:glucoamylase